VGQGEAAGLIVVYVKEPLRQAEGYANTYLRDKEDGSQDELLRRLVRWFEESEEASREAREKAERDQDYYDNKQLTQEDVNKLRDRGQPPIAINLIRRKVDTLRGMEVKQRSDPKAWPRTPADADHAEIATDTLRFVFDSAKYNTKVRKWVFKDILVPGWGGVQLQLTAENRPDKIARALQVKPNKRLNWKRTPWDRMFWDPHSAEHDFSDCLYRGLVLWKDKETALDMYRDDPNAQAIISSTFDNNRVGDTYDDKPRSQWVDASRKRIRIVQIWWKEMGDVMWAEFVQGGILSGGPSPFVDEYGDACDNFVWQSCYVDRDNNRHGIVRDMIDPQDEVNKRRSKSLHLLTVRQVVSDQGAVQDIEKAKKQLARPDGWIEKTPGLELEIIQNADLSSGQMQLLQHATAELEKMGPDESLQGRGSATSGRDRQAQQQAALISPGTIMDDLMWLDHRCYVLAWATVQKEWTAPQFIRVTDNDDAPRFVGLNEPLIDEATGQMVGMRNKPAEIDVDIIIQPTPDTVAIEQEVWTDFVTLLPTLVTMPPHLQEFSVELSPLPPSRKRVLMEKLKQKMEQAPPDPMQVRAVEAEVKGKEAAAAKTAAEAQKLLMPETAKPVDPLEQQKAQAEHMLKADDLKLQGRQLDIKERELTLKQNELAQKAAELASQERLELARMEQEGATKRDEAMRQEREALRAQGFNVPTGEDVSSVNVADILAGLAQSMAGMGDGLKMMAEAQARPKRVVRDPATGLVVGTE
jgi:hypothetical protein